MGPRLSTNTSIIDVATEIVNNVTNEVITKNSTTVSNTQSITINLNETVKNCASLMKEVNCKQDPRNMACNKEFIKVFCNTDIGAIEQEVTQTVQFNSEVTNELANKIFMELDKNLKNESEMKVTNVGLLSIDEQTNITKIRENFNQELVNRAVTETVNSYANNQIVDLQGAIPSGGVYQKISSDIISTSIIDNILNNSSEIKSAVDAFNKAQYESKGLFDFSLGGLIGLFAILFIFIVIFLIRRSSGNNPSTYVNTPPPMMMPPPMMYGPPPEPRGSRFKRKYISRFGNRRNDEEF